MPDFPRTYDFRAVEREVSAFWDKEKIPERTLKLDEKKPLFSFLEGPPTANAPPGLHHVQSRFYKDLVCRFYYMKGFSVPRKGGWDCHGLPVEVQAEKKLGLSTKKDVLKYGIGRFNKLCRDDVFTFIGDWNAMTKRMAFWVDLENPYVTLTNSYIESVWWSLKELFRKGLLYEDYKVVPYCPRCETPLSSHEVALGYEDVTEAAITVRFRLKGEESYLLAWTTTPWTLPGNIALAVGKDIVYAVVEENGVRYILAKDAVSRFFENPVILMEVTGDGLVGKEYIPVFDYFVGKLDKPAWKVIAAEFVKTEEGTGVVHQAPAFGEEDFEALKREGMAFVQPVDESGRFTRDVPDFEGRFVKDADSEIIEQLERDNAIFRKGDYRHSYPFCWRCSTPLLYYALMSWFVRVTAYKQRLIELNEGISWYPEHIKHGRFGDWLANVKDWALSRNKFWGTPLPIWKCDGCGSSTAIGSIEELEEGAGTQLTGLDLHKPAIDEVKIGCVCGRRMSRVPYVIDTWYDSGSASFAQFHYPFENKEAFGKFFPYSFISEAIDQTRGWFYTLHVLGTLLFDSNAFKSVVVGGLLVDGKGEKMSKSKGNTLNPMEVFDAVGVDAVRLQLCSSSPDNTKRFGYELVRENVAPFINTLWNVCVFSAELFKARDDRVSKLEVEDRWIISRVNSLVKEVSSEFEASNFHHCVDAIKAFVVDDLSRWYVRLVRGRNDDAVSDALHYALSAIARLLAPFAPHLSEFIYLNLVRGEEKSVHLSAWPSVEKIDAVLELEMSLAREIIQSILSVREGMSRSLRWPVKEAVVVSAGKDVAGVIERFSPLIISQANVMKVSFQPEFREAKTRLKADYAKLGPAYGEATPAIIAHFSMKSQDAILRGIRERGSFEIDVDGRKYELGKEHLIFSTEIPEKYGSAAFSKGGVYVDREMTPEMESDGFAREVVRVIQQSRKDAGLKKPDRVKIFVKVDSGTSALMGDLKARMKEKVGASEFDVSDSRPSGNYRLVKAHSIKERKVEVFFSS